MSAPHSISEALTNFGRLTIDPINAVGKYTLFTVEGLRRCFVPLVNMRLLVRQMEFIGNRSIGIVIISALMIGAVIGLTVGDIFRIFGMESMLGATAAFSLSKELAPVFTAFLVTARGGSAMAAEIGTMRVNEQIDAMRVMAVNPHGYLVAPRIMGTVVMMPLLTCVFILTGVFAAFLVGVGFFDVDVGIFFEKMRQITKPWHIVQGMQKAAIFGLILSSVGCYKGFYAGGGAKGVGRATTEAVVLSLVSILISDFFITYLQYDKAL